MISQLLLRKFLKCSSLEIFHKPFSIIPNYYSVQSSHLLKTPSPVLTQVSSFWESFPHIRPLFYEKDGLSRKTHKIVYHASLFNYAFYGQLTSMVVLTGQFIATSYYGYKSYIAKQVVVPGFNHELLTVHYDLLTVFMITIFSIQTALIYIAAQNVLLRAYYNEDCNEYVFVSLGVNPFKSHVIHSKPGDLIPLSEKWHRFIFGNHVLNGKRLYVKYDNFKTIYYYNQVIGNKFQ